VSASDDSRPTHDYLDTNSGVATRANHRVIGIVLALVSCSLYGVNPVFSVNAYDDGANSRGLMIGRFLIAAPLLLAYRLIAMRGIKWPRGRDLLEIFLFGFVGFTFQSFFYFGAIERMASGLVSVIFYCFPIMAVLLAWWLLKHKPSNAIWVCLVLTVAGVGLTAGEVSGAQSAGIALTLAGALTYTFYVVLSSRVMPRYDGITGLTIVLFGAMVGWLLLWAIRPFGMQVDFPTTNFGWLNIAVIATFGTIVPMGTFFAAMKRVGPGPTSVASAFEPVVTIAAGTLLLDERLTGRSVVGAALVIIAVVLLAVSEARRDVGSLTTASPGGAAHN
jgi:drug/metabolite transporter (DMT)-like permease